VVAVRRRRVDQLVLVGLPLAGAAAVAWGGTHVRGDLWPYLFTTGIGVSVAWWLAVGLVVLDAVRTSRARAALRGLPAASAPVLAAAGAAVVLVAAAGKLGEAAQPFAQKWRSTDADAFIAAAAPWCHQRAPVLILIPTGQWGDAMDLGDALAGCGASPRFEETWRFMAGDHWTVRPGDPERAAVTLVVGDASAPPAPGDVRLVQGGVTALDRRGPAPATAPLWQHEAP
jgi:hypothetical protein